MGKKGFTLIELLLAVSFIGILTAIGLASYNNYNQTQILKQAASDLKSNLRLAQNRAIAGEKPTGCGVLDGYQVSFTAANYTVQALCSGSPLGTVSTFNLPAGVSLTSPPSPVLFKVLGLGTNIPSFTITLSGFGKTESVIITPTGEIR